MDERKVAAELEQAAASRDGRQPPRMSSQAASALAGQANVSDMLLDMWLESARPETVKSAMLDAARALLQRVERQGVPDAVHAVLEEGADWGTAEVPPDVLRTAWRMGEAMEGWTSGKLTAQEFDQSVLDAAAAARRWFAARTAGRLDVLRRVEVLSAEGQLRLRELNSQPRPAPSEPPF